MTILKKYTPHLNVSTTALCFTALMIIGGIILRFRYADHLFIYMDENNTIYNATNHSYQWIVTHFTKKDSCIPLSFYYKVLLDTIGLNEFLMRLPSLIAGSLTIIIFSSMVWRVSSPLQSIIVCCIMCFSPYFIYLSQLARPYSIVIFLVLSATTTLFLWTKEKGRMLYLLLSAFCSSLAIYFHPIVFPAVGALQMYPMLLLVKKSIPLKKRREYYIATIFFIMLTSLLLGPAVTSLISELSNKGFKGKILLDTIRHGLMPILGLGITIPLLLYFLIAGIGMYSFTKNYKNETICIVVMVIAQLVMLVIIRPHGIHRPHCWLRYMAHLIPFWMLCIGAGLSTLVSLILGLRNQRSSFFAGSIMILLFIGYHFKAHHYPTHYDSFSINPQINLYYPDKYVLHNINKILPSPFYHTIANDSSDYMIVEATEADHYGGCFSVYQRYHRHRYIKGIFAAATNNKLNTLYNSDFTTMINVNTLDQLPCAMNVRYLIIHKKIGDEYQNVFVQHTFFEQVQQSNPLFRTQAKLDAAAIEEFIRTYINYAFKHQKVTPTYLKKITAPKIFEDDFIIVYDVRAHCSGTPGSRTAP